MFLSLVFDAYCCCVLIFFVAILFNFLYIHTHTHSKSIVFSWQFHTVNKFGNCIVCARMPHSHTHTHRKLPAVPFISVLCCWYIQSYTTRTRTHSPCTGTGTDMEKSTKTPMTTTQFKCLIVEKFSIKNTWTSLNVPKKGKIPHRIS